jgi:acyl-CoA thioesterase FadM
MGGTAWLSGHSVLAAKIEINFRAPLPIGTELTMWCEITRIAGRKVYTAARLEGDDGTVFSEGTGLFVVIDPEELFKKVGMGKW